MEKLNSGGVFNKIPLISRHIKPSPEKETDVEEGEKCGIEGRHAD